MPPSARGRLRDVGRLLDQVEDQLRRFSHELRPAILEDFGLIPALEALTGTVAKRTGLSIAMNGPKERSLEPTIETVIYRVVQEALTNVSKHAHATRVQVTVEREARRVHCSIRDDGVGFDVPAALARRGERGLGLIGIRERVEALAGTVEIVSVRGDDRPGTDRSSHELSRPGRGTDVRITIPTEA